MGLFNKIIKTRQDKKNKKFMAIKFIIIERLKPWIVLNCLEKDNYIISDYRAEEIAVTIINQAISLKVFPEIIKKIRIV